MRKELGIDDLPLPNGIARRLDIWHRLTLNHPYYKGYAETATVVRDQVLALRDIRNTVVHGLHAGDARPKSGSPYIACTMGGSDGPTGKTIRYSLDDLEHFLQATDACRRAFEHLGSFNYRLDKPCPSA
jgi:hypothetical protein